MRIESAERVKVFTVFDAPKLDPVTVVLQDVAQGRGRLLVECYGSAWSGYWGAIGDRTLLEFLVDCHPSYIAGNMHPTDRRVNKREAAYMVRIVEAVHSALRAYEIVGVRPAMLRHSANQCSAAFKWLQHEATKDGASPHAGVALDEWHGLAMAHLMSRGAA